MEFFDYLNSIDTELIPIEYDYWDKFHRWPADEIAKLLDGEHITDIGSGCGLLSCYLVWKGAASSADLYDPRPLQSDYAEKLASSLGLKNKITVHRTHLLRKNLQDATVVSLRLGSLQALEEFIYKNRLITCRRTSEVEPVFERSQRLPWNIKEIQYKDGFKLELMEYSYDQLVKLVSGERWMEDISPFMQEIIHAFDIKVVNKIGGDFVE